METENALAEQKPKRKAVSARLRFEVFKRDDFRCVYCGATPMQKMLRADHVMPVAAGGKSTSDNLVTSCHDCNAGKSTLLLGREPGRVASAIVASEARQTAEERVFLDCWTSRLGPLPARDAKRLVGRLRKLMVLAPAFESLDYAAEVVRNGLPNGYDAVEIFMCGTDSAAEHEEV